MEYKPQLALPSPGTTPGSLPSIPRLEYPSLPLDLIWGTVSRPKPPYIGFHHLISDSATKNSCMTFQGHSQGTDLLPNSSTVSPQGSPVVSPASPVSPTSVRTNEPKVARRRAQNREAQRRFRERREQQKMVLQRDAEELRKDYQTLLKQYAETANDLTRLVKENDMLRFEVRNLRQQWCLVLAVLQRLQSTQSLGASHKDVIHCDNFQDYLEDLASGPLANPTRYQS